MHGQLATPMILHVKFDGIGDKIEDHTNKFKVAVQPDLCKKGNSDLC